MSAPQICAKCCKPFTAGPILSALEKKWHPSCFVCVNCKGDLARSSFHVKDDTPYCINCWKQLYQPRCKGCNVIIEPEEQYVTYNDNAYHKQCFICSSCKQTLAGKQFIIQDDKFLCPEHA